MEKIKEKFVVYHLTALEYYNKGIEKKLDTKTVEHAREIARWFFNGIEYHFDKIIGHCGEETDFLKTWNEKMTKLKTTLSTRPIVSKIHNGKINYPLFKKKLIQFRDEFRIQIAEQLENLDHTSETNKWKNNRQEENRSYHNLFISADKIKEEECDVKTMFEL